MSHLSPRMEVNDVVLIRGLEGSYQGENWEYYNGRYGILEWRDAVDGVVVLNSGRTITLDLGYLAPTGVNVGHGRQVTVEGLTSSDWRPLNGKIGYIVGELRADGCIDVQFPPPWGTVPLRLSNLARVTEAQALMAQQHEVEAAVDNNGLAYMCKEGTLVEVHSLKASAWEGLNGVTGVICGPITQEADTLRVPVAFPDPWGDLPLLVSNIRPAANAKYVTLTRSFNDPSHGMTLDGMTVVEVDYGSPSWKAGVMPRDVIRAISNVPVWNMTDMIGHIPNVCQLTLETPSERPGGAGGVGSTQPRFQNTFERAINGERVGHRLADPGPGAGGYPGGSVPFEAQGPSGFHESRVPSAHSSHAYFDSQVPSHAPQQHARTPYELQLEERVAMLERQVGRTVGSPRRAQQQSDSPTSYALQRDRELMQKIANAMPADMSSSPPHRSGSQPANQGYAAGPPELPPDSTVRSRPSAVVQPAPVYLL